MSKALVVLVGLASPGLASQSAASAEYWYLWRYVVDGMPTDTTQCAQSVKGTWMQVSGPFKDSKCTVPATSSD